MDSAVAGMDEARFRRAFLEEAEEMLGNLSRRLVELEQDTGNASLVNEIFRLFHSLKSEAGLMGLTRLSDVAHRTEDVFDLLKQGKIELDRAVMDCVFAATDLINEMLARVSAGGRDVEFAAEAVLEQLDSCARGKAATGTAVAPPPAATMAEIRAEGVVELGRADRRQLEESRERRERLYRITCELEDTCPMKFARAYLILSNLESVASVIRSIPALDPPPEGEEPPEESYARFVVYLTTSGPLGALEEAVRVDEVKSCDLLELGYDEVLGTSERPAPSETPPEGDVAPPLRARAVPERTSIRVETRKLNDIWGLVGQLVITKGRLERLFEHAGAAGPPAELGEAMEEVEDSIGAITEGLQQAMMETRMVPIAVLFDKLPRLVRDLSKQVGKEADLEIRGETTEIDRSLVEALSDPLTHIMRNCMDHGLEGPEQRIRMGKPERGRISASAYQEGGKVVIEIADDGRGLDLQKIRAKAVERGLLRSDEPRSETELVDLIYQPGFSTAESVTDISGRGVGMDVVATRIRDVLKGEVRLRTEAGKGTRFTILLPLTLTILHTLVVRLDGRDYAIPIRSIDETAKLPSEEVRRTPEGEVAVHRGEEIAVFHLAELLGGTRRPREIHDAVVLTHRLRRAYLVVDELVEELDVVIKPVDDVVNPNGLFSGVSVLGDGRILLVLSTTFIGD